MAIFFRICVIINLLAVAALLLAYLAPFISPETSYWIALLGLGYPFLLIGNILWIIWWLYWKNRYVYFSLVGVGLGVSHIFNFIGISGGGTIPKDGGLKVLSYNVHYFNSLGNISAADLSTKQALILHYIKEQQPTFFCGQEFTGKTTESTQLSSNYMQQQVGLPYQHRGGGSSLAIYSKYPIVETGIISFEKSHNGAIFADIILPNQQRIRLYSMHLQSIGLGKDSDEVLKRKNLIHLQDDQTQEKYKRINSKLHHAFALRSEQAETLAAHVRACPYPVILAGDLNDTPLSYTYRRLSNVLNDSFWKRGWGLGTTYAGNLPMLRIDYIFASASISIHRHQVLSKPLTDHYPVVSVVSVK